MEALKSFFSSISLPISFHLDPPEPPSQQKDPITSIAQNSLNQKTDQLSNLSEKKIVPIPTTSEQSLKETITSPQGNGSFQKAPSALPEQAPTPIVSSSTKPPFPSQTKTLTIATSPQSPLIKETQQPSKLLLPEQISSLPTPSQSEKKALEEQKKITPLFVKKEDNELNSKEPQSLPALPVRPQKKNVCLDTAKKKAHRVEKQRHKIIDLKECNNKKKRHHHHNNKKPR